MILWRDARTVVADFKKDVLTITAAGNKNLSPRPVVMFDGVGDEIAYDKLELGRDRFDDRQIAFDLYSEVRWYLEQLTDIFDDTFGIYRRNCPSGSSHPRIFKQVTEQTVHAMDLGLH